MNTSLTSPRFRAGPFGRMEELQAFALKDVLHQTVYLVEPRHHPALERIAPLHFRVRLPPTTMVPIRGASPFRETRLEIEVTAHADSGSS